MPDAKEIPAQIGDGSFRRLSRPTGRQKCGGLRVAVVVASATAWFRFGSSDQDHLELYTLMPHGCLRCWCQGSSGRKSLRILDILHDKGEIEYRDLMASRWGPTFCFVHTSALANPRSRIWTANPCMSSTVSGPAFFTSLLRIDRFVDIIRRI